MTELDAALKDCDRLVNDFTAELLLAGDDKIKSFLSVVVPVDSGDLAKSFKSIPGRPTASVRGKRKRKSIRYVSDSPYGVIINRGRKLGVNPTKRKGKPVKVKNQTKVMGSTKAPRGIVPEIGNRMDGVADSLIEIAFEKASR